MYRIIVNPTAGAGRALATLPQVEEILRGKDIPYEIKKTERRLHASELARTAAQDGMEAVVSVGGDGTLSEVVNGLVGSQTALYVVSCGTGNDFVRSLGLPKDPIEALKLQLSLPMGTIDAAEAGPFRFVNVAGAGFDVEVLRQTEAYKKRFHGIVPYLIGVVRAVKYYKPLHCRLDAGDVHLDGEFTLIVIANGQYYGGGMRVAREADPYDGLFDVIYVPKLSKFRICTLLPFFFSGKYADFKVAHRLLSDSVHVSADAITVNMDGELRDMTDVPFNVLKGSLRMALPGKA